MFLGSGRDADPTSIIAPVAVRSEHATVSVYGQDCRAGATPAASGAISPHAA